MAHTGARSARAGYWLLPLLMRDESAAVRPVTGLGGENALVAPLTVFVPPPSTVTFQRRPSSATLSPDAQGQTT